jgi:hypothetical protein
VQDSTVNYSEPHECGFAAKIAPQHVAMDTNVAFLFSAGERDSGLADYSSTPAQRCLAFTPVSRIRASASQNATIRTQDQTLPVGLAKRKTNARHARESPQEQAAHHNANKPNPAPQNQLCVLSRNVGSRNNR